MQVVKKHKKLFIILGVILVVVILLSIFVSNLRKGMEQMAEAMNQVETVAVEKRTLVSSISATGTISSVQSKDVAATLSGVELKTLSVEVGDYVQMGDVLCEFDAEDINANLENAKESLNNSLAKTNIDLENAERSLAEAQATRDIQATRNTQAVETAWNDYKTQNDKANALDTEVKSLKASLEQKQADMEVKQKEIDALSGKESVSGSDATETAKELEKLTQELQNLQSECQTLQTSITAKQTELTQAQNTAKTLLNTYVKSAEAKEDSARSNDSNVLSREASLETSRLNASSIGVADKQQIENYEEQLEACVVTAPISGVITAVNMEAGDIYNGSPILTIEDDSAFVVEAQIDEYDIGKIQKGQEVVIKTNATGDEELSGTVIQVAPRATQGATGSVTYTVKVSVDTPNEMLRMDMTAKLSIILEKKENVLTVPYDAVCEDEDGNFYVEVVGSDGLQEQVPGQNSNERIYVTKGIESDYYIEVSGEGIEEGMQVVITPADSSMDIYMRMMQNGPMGGF